MVECTICGGQKYVMESGKRVACTCVRAQRLLAQYQFLKGVDFKKVDLKRIDAWVKPLLKAAPLQEDYLVLMDCKENDLFTFLALFLIHYGVKEYTLLNVYELREITFKYHPRFQSLYHINTPVVCLVMGFSESENKAQMEWILQLWDKCRLSHQHLLFVARPSEMKVGDTQLLTEFAMKRDITVHQPEGGSKKKGVYTA